MHNAHTKNIYELREISIEDVFDASSVFPHAHFTQSKVYARVQTASGREVKCFCVYKNNVVVGYFQYIVFPLFGTLTYAYIPYGPLIILNQDGLVVFIKDSITKIARTERFVFMRLDFDPILTKKDETNFFKAPKKSYKGVVFQPRNEWVLPVQKSNEELLHGMHEKTRYSIRTAEKREVTTEIITEDFQDYFEIFYTLMSDNARRNGFYLHPKQYYQNYFNAIKYIPHASLVLAKYQTDILCMYMFVPYADTVHYIFGASSYHEKNRMPTYAAHFKAMQYVRECGYAYYNFGGIESGADMSLGMRSLTAYKKKFGGKTIVHGGFYDIVTGWGWYFLYIIRKWIKSF